MPLVIITLLTVSRLHLWMFQHRLTYLLLRLISLLLRSISLLLLQVLQRASRLSLQAPFRLDLISRLQLQDRASYTLPIHRSLVRSACHCLILLRRLLSPPDSNPMLMFLPLLVGVVSMQQLVVLRSRLIQVVVRLQIHLLMQ